MFDRKLNLFTCLVGLALLVSLVGAQQPAPEPAVEPEPSAAPGAPVSIEENQNNIDYDDDDDDDDDGDDYDYDDDDYYDDVSNDGSPEESLADLSDEHFWVRQDCTDLKAEVDKAKAAAGATVDQELMDEYEGCKQTLKNIEQQMKQLLDQVFGTDASLLA